MNVPLVIENTHRGERVYDLYSRLLRDRIVLLGTPIDDNVANAVIAQLLFLESDDADRDIHLYINSPGGSVTAGLALYDTMQYVKPRVSTICVGQASSIAALLLAAGAPGRRFALPNAQVLIHQPSSDGIEGQASDIVRRTEELLVLKHRVEELFAHHTGHSPERIQQDTQRDHYLTAFEAKQYGLVDEVVGDRHSLIRPGR